MFRTPATDTRGLVTCLWDYPGVVEAAGVYGDSDVMARIEMNNEKDRDSMISKIIREIPLIESIETFTIQTGNFDPSLISIKSYPLYKNFGLNIELPPEYTPLNKEQILEFENWENNPRPLPVAS